MKLHFKQSTNIIFTASQINDGNMSLHRGNKQESINNRKKFLASLGIHTDQTVSMAPSHGNKVSLVTRKDAGKGMTTQNNAFDADALITNEENLYLFLVVADCIPLALYNPKNKAIGLIHGSRMSLEKGIIAKTLDAMNTRFGTEPKDMYAQFGPSIGPCCYTLQHVEQLQNKQWHQYIKKERDLYTINIWQFAEDELLRYGCVLKNIHNPQICTYHSKKYFSHRRFVEEKLATDFRFATILGLLNRSR